jgi:hypothetical protein
LFEGAFFFFFFFFFFFLLLQQALYSIAWNRTASGRTLRHFRIAVADGSEH